MLRDHDKSVALAREARPVHPTHETFIALTCAVQFMRVRVWVTRGKAVVQLARVNRRLGWPTLGGEGMRGGILTVLPRPASRQSESSIVLGWYPARLTTVTADVLSRLLNGDRLTSDDARRLCSTSRLAAIIHTLGKRYGWRIDRGDKAVGCKDGRMTLVTEYWLSREVVVKAQRLGVRFWCAQVREARRAQRAKAVLSKIEAARINARRAGNSCGQLDLFADVRNSARGE